MPFLSFIVPYLAAGGAMWLTASQMAQFGREIKLSKCIASVFLLGLVIQLNNHLLRGNLQPLALPIDYLAGILIVKTVLNLTFWRSVATVTVYFTIMLIALVILRNPPGHR